MKSKKEELKWFYHAAVVCLVIYELCTVQDASITVGNWMAVFVVVGLVSTFISLSYICFQVGRIGMKALLRKLP